MRLLNLEGVEDVEYIKGRVVDSAITGVLA